MKKVKLDPEKIEYDGPFFEDIQKAILKSLEGYVFESKCKHENMLVKPITESSFQSIRFGLYHRCENCGFEHKLQLG